MDKKNHCDLVLNFDGQHVLSVELGFGSSFELEIYSFRIRIHKQLIQIRKYANKLVRFFKVWIFCTRCATGECSVEIMARRWQDARGGGEGTGAEKVVFIAGIRMQGGGDIFCLTYDRPLIIYLFSLLGCSRYNYCVHNNKNVLW